MNLVFSGGPSDAAEAFLMLAIADNADDKGRAFPGIALLAQKSRQSERNVMRVLRSLELQGWLMVKRRAAGVKLQGNVYQLNMAKLEAMVGAKAGRVLRSDRMSGGLAPDAGNNGASVAPSDTVSGVETDGGDEGFPEGRGDNSRGVEVTNPTIPGDKTVLPILKNHQEPSLEPNTPPTPASGGGGLHIAEAGSRNANANGNGKDFPDEREGVGCASCSAADAAVAKVMRECSLSNPRLERVIHRAMEAEHALSDAAVVWNATAERMIHAWREFGSVAQLMRHSVGARKFFSEGMWCNWKLWPYDRQAVSEARRL